MSCSFQVFQRSIQLLLLRACLDACKVSHLLRSSNSFVAKKFLDQATCAIRNTLEDIVGVGLSDAQWQHAILPMRLGGLGIKSPALQRAGARVAAHIGFLHDAHEAVGVPLRAIAIPPDDLQQVLAELAA